MSTATVKIARYMINHAEKREHAKSARTWVQTLIRLVLHLAGFGCLTIAGFYWTITAGYVVAGLSCFAMAWLSTPDTSPAQPPVR